MRWWINVVGCAWQEEARGELSMGGESMVGPNTAVGERKKKTSMRLDCSTSDVAIKVRGAMLRREEAARSRLVRQGQISYKILAGRP